MTRSRFAPAVVLTVSLLALLGCRDPAASVPSATVGAPAAEGTAAAAPTSGTTAAEGTATAAATNAAEATAAVAAEGTAVAAAGTGAAEGTGAAAAVTEIVTISPANAAIGWTASKITASHDGSFGGFTGTIVIDPADLTRSRIDITIDATTIAADNERLTGHLKSPEFFDVAQFPTATFVSSAITAVDTATAPTGVTHNITGVLTMHGQSQTITFPAIVTVDAERVKASAEFSINRQDFGLTYPGRPDDLIRDAVILRLNVDAVRGSAN